MRPARGGPVTAVRVVFLAGACAGPFAACDGEVRFDEPVALDAGGEAAVDAPAGVNDVAPRIETSAPVSRACQDDLACAAAHGRCIPAQGVCVACLDDADCASGFGPRRECDPKSHMCVECTEASHCGPGRYCDPGTSRCVEWCFDEGKPCDTVGFTCIAKDKHCGECSRNENCKGGAEPFCNTFIGQCVECMSSAQCTSGKRPVCLRYTGRCVECMNDLGCAAPARCDTRTGTCVQ
jgi:Cys-rich repeat protein